jgi:hypothetical protein
MRAAVVANMSSIRTIRYQSMKPKKFVYPYTKLSMQSKKGAVMSLTSSKREIRKSTKVESEKSSISTKKEVEKSPSKQAAGTKLIASSIGKKK